jgi:hypothetical protein
VPESDPDVDYYDADPECAVVSQRIAAKEGLCARLAAGKVSLADAVREYLVLNQAAPVIPECRYDLVVGRSLGERVATLLTFSVASRLAEDPRRERVLDNLAREQAGLVASETREWAPDRPRPPGTRDHALSRKLPIGPP